MTDRNLIDRLYDRQVCSAAQNRCRNDDHLDAAIEALASSEARERTLREALSDCHDFFGQMYAHGVALSHAGEQHLERASKGVADLLATLPDAPAPETGDTP